MYTLPSTESAGSSALRSNDVDTPPPMKRSLETAIPRPVALNVAVPAVAPTVRL